MGRHVVVFVGHENGIGLVFVMVGFEREISEGGEGSQNCTFWVWFLLGFVTWDFLIVYLSNWCAFV